MHGNINCIRELAGLRKQTSSETAGRSINNGVLGDASARIDIANLTRALIIGATAATHARDPIAYWARIITVSIVDTLLTTSGRAIAPRIRVHCRRIR